MSNILKWNSPREHFQRRYVMVSLLLYMHVNVHFLPYQFFIFFTCFNVCAGKSYLLIFKIICVYGLHAFFPKLWWECSGRRNDLRCPELRFSLLANVLLFLYFPVAIARPDLPCFSVCKLLCTLYFVFFGQSLPFMC